MKLALVISTSDAAFDALAFKGDLENGVRMAKEIGYDAVEIAVRDPKTVNVTDMRKLLDELNMGVSAIGTGQGYLAEGLNMVDENDEIQNKTMQRLRDHVDFASEFGAMVIIGFIRGTAKGRPRKEVEDIFVKNLTKLADYAAGRNVKIVVEPLNRYETDFINTLSEAGRIIERVGAENVGILADTFHMNIEEVDICEELMKIKDKLYHFHVADSNRWAPGAGHLDFKPIIETLRKAGYRDYIAVECLPLPGGARESAELAFRTMKDLLSELSS